MFTVKKRGWLAGAGALVTAAALALGGAVAAQAAANAPIPKESGLVITKLEQPDQPGSPATGLPVLDPGTVIPGVTFEGHRVPLDNDPLSNEGQREIAGIDLKEAVSRVGADAAERVGTTDAAGEIRWQSGVAGSQGDTLQAGLWLIRETQTPPGVVASGGFLVAVPLTNPENPNTWLDTIHVYPKNQTVSGSKTVENLDQFVVGDTVRWTIDIENPSPRNNEGDFIPADMFRVLDTLTDEFLTTAADGSDVNVTGPANLVRDVDYTISLSAASGKTTITIDFTEAGLLKLSKSPTESVVIEIDTVIEKEGAIENSAQFFTSETQTDPGDIPGTDMKYGTYALVKKSEGAPSETSPQLAGAEFMVFSNEEDAIAAQNGDAEALKRALKPKVTVPGYDPATGIWTTNDQGRVDISGLRYSGYANGESFGPADPRYVKYWLVETKALANHQLLVQPVSFIVDETSATQDSETIVNQYNRGGFLLPLTGGTGTLMLTLAGLALLAAVLIVARRRMNANAVSSE